MVHIRLSPPKNSTLLRVYIRVRAGEGSLSPLLMLHMDVRVFQVLEVQETRRHREEILAGARRQEKSLCGGKAGMMAGMMADLSAV